MSGYPPGVTPVRSTLQSRVGYRVSGRGNVIVYLETETAGLRSRGFGEGARPPSEPPRRYPSTIPSYEGPTGLTRAAGRILPVPGLPRPLPRPEAAMAAYGGPGGGFRVVAVIPYASLGVYKQWSASVPKSGRRYIGAAWALWNGRFTPNGESSSYIPLDVRGLVPPSERPGASPVSVPTILSLISAAGQTLSGFTNRVSEALKRGGWRSCGMLVGSEYATYCPPLPPPGSPHFVPASVEGGQFRFA